MGCSGTRWRNPSAPKENLVPMCFLQLSLWPSNHPNQTTVLMCQQEGCHWMAGAGGGGGGGSVDKMEEPSFIAIYMFFQLFSWAANHQNKLTTSIVLTGGVSVAGWGHWER